MDSWREQPRFVGRVDLQPQVWPRKSPSAFCKPPPPAKQEQNNLKTEKTKHAKSGGVVDLGFPLPTKKGNKSLLEGTPFVKRTDLFLSGLSFEKTCWCSVGNDPPGVGGYPPKGKQLNGSPAHSTSHSRPITASENGRVRVVESGFSFLLVR